MIIGLIEAEFDQKIKLIPAYISIRPKPVPPSQNGNILHELKRIVNDVNLLCEKNQKNIVWYLKKS